MLKFFLQVLAKAFNLQVDQYSSLSFRISLKGANYKGKKSYLLSQAETVWKDKLKTSQFIRYTSVETA